ncbi:MAG TPA: tagaturonate reductase [Xanthomonadaceae bacterium]|nr:tagaturonate reductase [Xanthomonadaceae bacterium]
MFALNRSTLPDPPKPAGAPPRAGVLQIGDGNFLRGFADWMIDLANEAGVLDAAVTLVPPLPANIIDPLNAQGGLFTVLTRGVQGGAPTTARRIVRCVTRGVDPYRDPATLLACARDPKTRFVISNTTEAGIVYREQPCSAGEWPRSFPAQVAALLLARFEALGGQPDTGLVFLPCELIEANGTTLREIVLRHARDWTLPQDFSDWVTRHNHFLNTLVDRIVPGYPATEADRLFAEFGYTDILLVAAEPFHLWVIEGPERLANEFPLHKAGLNVVWTDDLQPYRTRKVRILNGAHTASVLAAFCGGLDTVGEMMEDPVVSRFLQRVVFDEIVPFVPLPEAERRGYAESVLERFANPYIRHELLSIALNSVSKWTVRVLPSLLDYIQAHGRAPAGLAFSLAALLRFYRGRFDAAGEFVGQREAGSYPIRDNRDVLDIFDTAWRDSAHARPADAVPALLADARLWGMDLQTVPELAPRVARALDRIETIGMRPALTELLAG